MMQSYYNDSIEAFLKTNIQEIVGRLNLGGTSYASQWTITSISWESSIQILKNSFEELIQVIPYAINWHIFLEYEIPRLARRIDAIVIADDLIFVIEFKLDREKFELADLRQAEDYALDLYDFHFESKGKIIIPILLAPLAKSVNQTIKFFVDTTVVQCVKSNKVDFNLKIQTVYQKFHNPSSNYIDPQKWGDSEYQPTPTIVQAAKALFAGQKVEDITKYGADNLSKTSKYLIDVINKARDENKKIVCFVTGVPGAGKTLVGLDIVHEKEKFGGDDFNTAYFSGNSPLINVLREALSRDQFARQKTLYQHKKIQNRPTKKDSDREVKSKIQNLHHFIKDGVRKSTPPTERIVVFDEAQRCWNAIHYSNKAKQNRNREQNPFVIEVKSEAELLFEFMNRHAGWAVIIALVGGGQEINTGEGGIGEWGKATQEKFHNWEIHISPQLLAGDSSTADQRLFKSIPEGLIIHQNEQLHLKVSQRSFKATNLNSWVNAIIDNDAEHACELAQLIKKTYPLLITRDINSAKAWLRTKKAGTKRIGLVASSGGLRLKPYGIHVKDLIDEAMWFLNNEGDIRSSYYLEIAATEYEVQGLELDWIGVCWDADLRRNVGTWEFRNFTGTKWQHTNTSAEQQFLLNTYRVLLTRAREGLVIFVPNGDEKDFTRLPMFYNPIYEYLKSCGLDEIDKISD